MLDEGFSVDYAGLSLCHSERTAASVLADLGWHPVRWWPPRPETLGRDVVTRLKEERAYRLRMREELDL